jgi:hypothetical protein
MDLVTYWILLVSILVVFCIFTNHLLGNGSCYLPNIFWSLYWWFSVYSLTKSILGGNPPYLSVLVSTYMELATKLQRCFSGSI